MHIQQLYEIYRQHPSIQTDSRKLQKGDLFFALKGPSFNGNHFARLALDTGAAYVIVDEELSFCDDRVIQTGNVLVTLQQLAAHHRNEFDTKEHPVPFIAITGTNGKTTTKELIHEVLSSTYITCTTHGNLNNHIGIPITLLNIRPDAQMAVIEMGANHLLEIKGYCEYARPTHGLITNCSKAHLEGFGSEEGVRKAKGELYDHLRSVGGTAFINVDLDYLVEMSAGIEHVITYGRKEGWVTGSGSLNDGLLTVSIKAPKGEFVINTKLIGIYNLPNVLAAVTIGLHFNIDSGRIVDALQNYLPSNSRSQLMHSGSNTIIMDAYNANPGSMKVAIENFAMIKGDKILLLGGMMELGNESEKEHKTLIDLISKYPWKDVVLVGHAFSSIDHPYKMFNDSSEAAEWLKSMHFENVKMLVKGSRGIQMEKVLGT